MSVFTRARGLELWDRVRLDALGLVGSVAQHTMPKREWADRIDAAIVRRRPAPRHRMLPLLETFAGLHEDAFFIQIGANDGEQQDPLRDLVLAHQWAGIMIEPVPYVFERLRGNYGAHSRIKLENLAIGAEDGEVTFYHLAQADDAGRPGLPSWFDALGSMRKEVVLSHARFIPDIEERIVETKVPAVTFESLCRRHGVTDFDLLLTDTEGYDYEILKRVDFSLVRPKFIIYEHEHLDPDDRTAAVAHLRSYGYETVDYGLDTWCLNPGRLSETERSALLPIWRWIERAPARARGLLPTRAIRHVGRRVVGPRSPES